MWRVAHICSFFLQRNLKLKQKYTGPFIKPCHGEERERERERERRERGRDSKDDH